MENFETYKQGLTIDFLKIIGLSMRLTTPLEKVGSKEECFWVLEGKNFTGRMGC